jgi:hypothetical protein
MDFTDESLSERGVSRKFECLYLSHKVPVVVIMPVVITKYAPVVHGTSSQVDVSKAVGNHLIFKPNLLFKSAPFLLPLSRCVSLVVSTDDFFLAREIFYHREDLKSPICNEQLWGRAA